MTAALWLAVGTAAGVLVGVTLADRGGGGKKLLGRLRGALQFMDGLAAGQGTGNAERETERVTDVPAEDEDLDDIEYSAQYDSEYAAGAASEYDYDADAEEEHIGERVLAAFEQDPILAERDIEIEELEPAVIGLSGHVSTARDVKHAVTIAGGVPGVERVESSIRVLG